MPRKHNTESPSPLQDASEVGSPAAETGRPKRSAPRATTTTRRVTRRKAATVEMQAAAGNGDGSSLVSREEIARLAYFYWEARGRQNGSPEEDWHRAEQELKSRAASAAA